MHRTQPYSDLIHQSQLEQTEKSCSARPLAIMGVALFIIAAGSVVLTYFYNPSFQQMMDQSFRMTQLTTQQALLYFTVPVVGASLLIGMGLYIRSKHHERLDSFRSNEQVFDLADEFVDQNIKTTLKEMLPTKRQLAITMMVVGTLAILGFIGFAVCNWLPAGNQWWQQVADPSFNHPFAMWEALAYFGGIPAGVALIAGLAIAGIRNHRLKMEDEKSYNVYQDFIE